jgi:apolipoprotein N-acyltransferase
MPFRFLEDFMLPSLLASGFSGLLLVAAFPRWNKSYLLAVALLPLLWALRGQSRWTAFGLGFLSGLVFYLGLLSWIVYVTHVFGKLPLPLAFGVLLLLAGYLSLYRGLWAWGVVWAQERQIRLLWFAPALWVALELGQTYIISGFPWELLGHGLYRHPLLLQLADLTGVYGLSFLLVLVNMGLLELLAPTPRGRRFRKLKVLGLLLVVLTGWLGYGYWRLGQVSQMINASPKLKVAVVQGNIKQGEKWDPKIVQATLETYGRLTAKTLERDQDRETGDQPPLVIWPETAAPFFFHHLPDRDTPLDTMVKETARKNRVFLLFGAPAAEKRAEGERLFNRAYLLDPEGKVVGHYDKAHLVPFGEYVPLERILFFVSKMVPLIGDFAEGPVGKVVPFPESPLGVLICYESIFGYLSRAQVQNGARLLVNITNDAWFGDTSAPYQHMSMAVLRAVENRVALARAANTGISAFINGDGRVLWTSPLNQEAAHTLKLPVLPGGSFYTAYGDLFAWTCLVLVAMALLFTRQRRWT